MEADGERWLGLPYGLVGWVESSGWSNCRHRKLPAAATILVAEHLSAAPNPARKRVAEKVFRHFAARTADTADSRASVSSTAGGLSDARGQCLGHVAGVPETGGPGQLAPFERVASRGTGSGCAGSADETFGR